MRVVLLASYHRHYPTVAVLVVIVRRILSSLGEAARNWPKLRSWQGYIMSVSVVPKGSIHF